MRDLRKPEYPKRDSFASDKQYLEAIRIFKKQRRQWINQDKDKDILAKDSIEDLKKRKKYRTQKDSQFKKDQLNRMKQKRLF